MCEVIKITVEWNFSSNEIFLFKEIKQFYSTYYIFLFPLFLHLRVINKKEIKKKKKKKKCGVTGLVFKINVIAFERGVKLVAMQQKSANLIYGLSIIKGTVESCLKKIAQSIVTLCEASLYLEFEN